MKKLKSITVLLALVLLLESGYCVAVFTDWVPPLSDLRDQFIETALGTMEHKWLATALIPGDIVLAVKQEMDAARDAQLGLNSSPWETGETSEMQGFFDLFPELDEADFRDLPDVDMFFYVNQAGLEDAGTELRTRQGDQVLAIDARNGLLVIRIREEMFRGVLILGKDPGRLSCAAAESWGEIGQTAGQIAAANNALVALTASGFEADGPEGAYQTGAAMCGGTVYGSHLKSG